MLFSQEAKREFFSVLDYKGTFLKVYDQNYWVVFEANGWLGKRLLSGSAGL